MQRNLEKLSPTTAKRMLVVYQLEQQAQKYLDEGVAHEAEKRILAAEDAFERAARLGNNEAKYRLGLIYGRRKPANSSQSTSSSSASSASSTEKTRKDAIPLWKEAAAAGHVNARYEHDQQSTHVWPDDIRLTHVCFFGIVFVCCVHCECLSDTSWAFCTRPVT
jgi:TPR repeat protein